MKEIFKFILLIKLRCDTFGYITVIFLKRHASISSTCICLKNMKRNIFELLKKQINKK